MISQQAGSPVPLGSSLTPQGINFAVFSRHAQTVTLVISTIEGASTRKTAFRLDPAIHKTGDIWHILLCGAPPDLLYGFSMAGPYDPTDSGHAYDSSLVLIDPYAREIHSPAWGNPRNCLGQEPCCLVDLHRYDWEGDRPLQIPLRDSIIYEMHVRGFTRHPSSGVAHPGTFQGVIEKLGYLRQLGITAVELMPVTEFNENEAIFVNPENGTRLKNYWGYSPLSFFAPKSAYSSRIESPLNEFRDMVKALHRAGIEVILDIVYNHTSEGGADGPTTSFRGIDNTIYYLLDPWTRAYLNFSGCGNTCNCNHPIVRNLIMDALRWWVVDMHVDGFRFDLASILGRDARGQVLANPPVVEMIAEDPILATTKIIAEAWDASGLYQVGSFSTHQRWAEWNGRFRDDVRSFMCGHPGKVPPLATRIAGSSDLYQHHGRRPCNSINFITSHDGFTLADLVSYNHKHNLMNGEDNRDGDNHNLSWNSGAEGPSRSRAINALRNRRIRTMATILFLSQGVPMIVAGDEFGRSQRGNNNAWCQDNDISWLDWRLAEKNADLLRFFSALIRLRKAHAIFRREDFFRCQEEGQPPRMREVTWQGARPGEEDWSADSHILAFHLHGEALADPDDDFFVMLNGNAATPARFIVPSPPAGCEWRKIIDTGQPGPNDFLDPGRAERVLSATETTVVAMGCVVLQSAIPR